MRKYQNIKKIDQLQKNISRSNRQIGSEIKQESSKHDEIVIKNKQNVLQCKQIDAVFSYQRRKEALDKKAVDKKTYLDSIQRINHLKAFEQTAIKEKHDNHLRKLEEVE